MKRILFLLCAALVATACGDSGSNNDGPKEQFQFEQSYFGISADAQPVTVEVTTNVLYNIEMPVGKDWISQAEDGDTTDDVWFFDVEANLDEQNDRTAEIFFVTENGNRHKVTVKQAKKGGSIPDEPGDPFMTADYDEDTPIAHGGGNFVVTVSHNVDFTVNIPFVLRSWIHKASEEVTGEDETTVTFTIDPNLEATRSGTITLSATDLDDIVVAFTQATYVSSNFSADGNIRTVQEASLPGGAVKGIDLVFIGDGFTDRDISNGTYMDLMEKAIDHYFDIEPHKSFKSLYNIYIITAVSHSADLGIDTPEIPGSPDSPGDTALKCWYTSNDRLASYNYHEDPDNNLVMDYIQEIDGRSKTGTEMQETVAVVVMNKKGHYGRSMWDRPSYVTDYGSGFAASLVSLGDTDNNFKGLIIHESGHSFAKLADEYIAYNYAAPANNFSKDVQAYGWCKNLSFVQSPLPWQKFIDNPVYAGEEMFYTLGAYEGGTYRNGAWKPTQMSFMNQGAQTGVGKFNAPSREAIYYRIHKLVYGASWEYDFEEFVAWDQSVDLGHR